MSQDSVERRQTGFYIVGSRVPLDRIVREYRNGEDAETIQSHYPTLTLDQVNRAIVFYHNHQEEVGRAMEQRRLAEDAYTAANPNAADIEEKFERMRETALRRI